MEIRPKNSSESPTSWSGVEIPEFFLSLWSVVVLEKDIRVGNLRKRVFICCFSLPNVDSKDKRKRRRSEDKEENGKRDPVLCIAQERH